jgi:hypothetical protein
VTQLSLLAGMIHADVDARLSVGPLDKRAAQHLAVERHYLHRRANVSHAYGLFRLGEVMGVVTFGVPASRHLQMSACPSDPGLVMELNRLWVDDEMGHNTESWFVSRALKMLPPLIIVSYADTGYGYLGYVYRALNFHYAGWTDMDRKTPRYDYIVTGKHTRDAFRDGTPKWDYRVRRLPKVKYWIATGNHAERKAMTRLCGWPSMDWHTTPPPNPVEVAEEPSA